MSFKDYAYKVWNSNPQELDPELARRRVAVSGIIQLIKGIIFKDTKKISADYFYYPPEGMKQLFDSLVKKIEKNNGKIISLADISKISIEDNKVTDITFNKKKIVPDYVISTIPLDSLMSLMPKDNDFDSSKIKYQDLNVIYFVLKKSRALKDCWVFFPEKKFIFQRVSEQKAFSESTSPKDKTVLMVETTQEVDKILLDKIIKQLEETKILKKEEIEETFTRKMSKAYPIYKKGFSQELSRFIKFAEGLDNFYLLGRQGLFNYNNMDQCWDMALKISEQIKNNKTKQDWQKTKEYFNSYRIVD